MKKIGALLLAGMISFGLSIPKPRAETAAKPTALFIGSSTIALWPTLPLDFPEWNTINLGRSGTTYANAVLAYRQWVEPALKFSQMIFLYSGDNDLAEHQTPTAILENIRTLTHWIHRDRPEAEIWVLTVKVSPARLPLRAHIEELNALIRQESLLNAGFGVVEMEHALSASSGLPISEYFARDGLHLSHSGYAIWRRQMRQAALGE